MAGEWSQYQVSDLIANRALVVGDGYRAKNEELSDSGLPFARAGNINDGFHFDDAGCFPEHDLQKVGNKISRPGDVVFTSKGTVGRFAFVRDDTPHFVYSPQLCFWRSQDRNVLDPRFLSFWMSSREFFVQFSGVAGQTDMAEYVSLTDQRRMHITLPPVSEQRAIAHILGTLDDKIELNRRMNDTLEAMARALFKSWFVDFDPVRAKQQSRPSSQPFSQREQGLHPPSPSGRGVGGEGDSPIHRNASIPTALLAFARDLRRQATDAETLLWRFLRDRNIEGAKFRRQHPCPPYVLDFYCHELKLAVELDGSQHNEEPGRVRDARGDHALAERGILVLRFWNNDVLGQTEGVLTAIYQAIVDRGGAVSLTPTPLPPGEGLTGLPPHLADLFPDSFEDSELGEIPRGWKVWSLDEVGHFLNGLALQKYPPQSERSLPVIKIAQLRAGNTDGADRASADLNPDYIVQDGDILFSWSGSLECVLWAGGPGALNQHLFKVTSASYPKWLCYLSIHQHLDDFRHIAAGKATTMGHIQRHHLSDARLAVPGPELLRAMDAVVAPIVESVWHREVQSRTLAALRDTLLPKLISGELRLKDAERFAARVGVVVP